MTQHCAAIANKAREDAETLQNDFRKKNLIGLADRYDIAVRSTNVQDIITRHASLKMVYREYFNKELTVTDKEFMEHWKKQYGTTPYGDINSND